MLQKFHSDKINGTKNALFFLSRALTNQFTINSRFYYELKHMFISLKLCVGFFIFDFVSFLLSIFLFNKKHGLFWLSQVIISFKIKIKALHSFGPRPLIFKLQQEVWKSNDTWVSWSTPKIDLERNFSITIFRESLEYLFHHFSSVHEIYFLDKFFEANLLFIPLNIIILWVRSVVIGRN